MPYSAMDPGMADAAVELLMQHRAELMAELGAKYEGRVKPAMCAIAAVADEAGISPVAVFRILAKDAMRKGDPARLKLYAAALVELYNAAAKQGMFGACPEVQ